MKSPGQSLHVLIVDDSVDDADLLAEALRAGGFSVIAQRVESSLHLQEWVADQDCDLILCDNNLPELDALRALDIVRRYQPDIPFIIVSGWISEDYASEVMKRGAADYISKHNLSRLLPVVERELKRSAAHRDLAWANQRIRRLVRYDGMTGLPNRQYLLDYLEKALLSANADVRIAVIMIELSRYKELIMGVGRSREEALLAACAERLSMFNQGGVLGRIGEDLFALVSPMGTNVRDVEGKVLDIVESFRSPLCVGDDELFVSCRIGSSVSSDRGGGVDALLGQAETALRCARSTESGGFCFYCPGMECGRNKMEMERALYHAVLNNEFTLAYQPQFSLATRQVVGVEALLRWQRDGIGWVSPAEFIPLLEETGLILQVGEWVLRTACTVNRNWQMQGLPRIKMAVNLSALQFRQPHFPEKIGRILADTGLQPEYLELEITENIAMHSEPEIIATLNELKVLGVELALDDFGTGYSSLSYLKNFPIGKLKIDQSFIRDIVIDKANKAIVTAILAIAASFGLNVIAEGVETREQAMLLEAWGCTEIQGYYFSRPVQEEELKILLMHANGLRV